MFDRFYEGLTQQWFGRVDVRPTNRRPQNDDPLALEIAGLAYRGVEAAENALKWAKAVAQRVIDRLHRSQDPRLVGCG
jgi:hypothetical protein